MSPVNQLTLDTLLQVLKKVSFFRMSSSSFLLHYMPVSISLITSPLIKTHINTFKNPCSDSDVRPCSHTHTHTLLPAYSPWAETKTTNMNLFHSPAWGWDAGGWFGAACCRGGGGGEGGEGVMTGGVEKLWKSACFKVLIRAAGCWKTWCCIICYYHFLKEAFLDFILYIFLS